MAAITCVQGRGPEPLTELEQLESRGTGAARRCGASTALAGFAWKSR
jgi:hypothetical protein